MTLEGVESLETAKRTIRESLANVRKVRIHEKDYELEYRQIVNLRRVDLLLLDALTLLGL